MNICAFSYTWSWRDLKKIITGLLKSWNAIKIQKLNYGQMFYLKDKDIVKENNKLILIHTTDKEKLTSFTQKYPTLDEIIF